MRKAIMVYVVFALAAASAARQTAGRKITAQSILDDVKAKDAQAVMREYTSRSLRGWHFILKQVETGDSQ